MIKLKNKTLYTNSVSSICFWVLKIHYENDEIIKCKGRIVDKHGIQYQEKNYKLKKENIGDWYEVG